VPASLKTHSFQAPSAALVRFLLALLVLVWNEAHCASLEAGQAASQPPRVINLSPIFFLESNPEKGSRELEILGPLFHSFKTPETQGWTVAPLCAYTRAGGTSTLDFLYPLGRWQGTEEGYRWRLTPLFTTGWHTYADDGSARHTFLWPVYWGSTSDRRSYGGFFPLYGTFLDKFGRDEIRFFLWPLYADSRWGGNRRTTLIWPFFSRVSGTDENGWRFFPLWGHSSKNGSWDRRFVLWPFFLDEHLALDTARPVHRKTVFPLYIGEKAEGMRKKIFLWPFFLFYSDDHQNFSQTDLPWPFFRYARGPDYKSWRLWPFWGEKETPESTDRFILWPVFSESTRVSKEKGTTDRTRRFLLLSKVFRKYDLDGNRLEELDRIWPLYYTHRDSQKYRIGFVPAVLPVEDPGFHRIYGPFLRVYEFQEELDGSGGSKAFWGLYRHDWAGAWDRKAVSMLFLSERSEKCREWRALGGMFGIRNWEGKRDYLLLYRPLRSWTQDLMTLVRIGTGGLLGSAHDEARKQGNDHCGSQ
jgi:hypothetical protein